MEKLGKENEALTKTPKKSSTERDWAVDLSNERTLVNFKLDRLSLTETMPIARLESSCLLLSANTMI